MEDEAKFEILEAIADFSESVDHRFDAVESRLTNVESRLTNVESNLTGVKAGIGSLKSQMVTKDYLDRKLYEVRGDMVAMVRCEISGRGPER